MSEAARRIRVVPALIGTTVTVGVPVAVARLTPRVGSRPNAAVVALIGAEMLDGLLLTLSSARRIYYDMDTPLGDRLPPRLLQDGVFAVRRNPMTVGVVRVLLGWAVLLGRPGVLAWSAFVLAGSATAIAYKEEPSLRRRFGTTYEEYCRGVRKWGWLGA